MSWEQDISQLLQTLEDSAVRFDVDQELTNTQKSTAKANVDFGATATVIDDNYYKIVMA